MILCVSLQAVRYIKRYMRLTTEACKTIELFLRAILRSKYNAYCVLGPLTTLERTRNAQISLRDIYSS